MDHLPTLVLEARDAIQAAQSVSALDELRVRYLGWASYRQKSVLRLVSKLTKPSKRYQPR